MTYLVISVGTALALFVLMLKIGLRRVLGYDIYVDIGCTILLIFIFQGTVTGTIAATMAGLILSIILYLCKLLVGCSRYEPVTEDSDDYEWKSYPPVWKRW